MDTFKSCILVDKIINYHENADINPEIASGLNGIIGVKNDSYWDVVLSGVAS